MKQALKDRAEIDIQKYLDDGFSYQAISDFLEDGEALEKEGYDDHDTALVECMHGICRTREMIERVEAQDAQDAAKERARRKECNEVENTTRVSIARLKREPGLQFLNDLNANWDGDVC